MPCMHAKTQSITESIHANDNAQIQPGCSEAEKKKGTDGNEEHSNLFGITVDTSKGHEGEDEAGSEGGTVVEGSRITLTM